MTKSPDDEQEQQERQYIMRVRALVIAALVLFLLAFGIGLKNIVESATTAIRPVPPDQVIVQ